MLYKNLDFTCEYIDFKKGNYLEINKHLNAINWDNFFQLDSNIDNLVMKLENQIFSLLISLFLNTK